MEFLSNLATGFIGLFQAGAETFMGFMTGIIPLLIVLMTGVNALIKLIGEKKVERVAALCSRNVVLRYTVLPFLAAFFLTNPMLYTFGRFVKEEHKAGYNDAALSICHYPLGVFPHINAGEIFTWMGIATGVTATGVNLSELAIRYFLFGFIVIFMRGYSTEIMFRLLSGKRLKAERRA